MGSAENHMSLESYPIELLAPAKDLACGISAINSGADAVYIGASRFGARENAGNSLSDIAELINYAHLYWAKVYAAVNTILFDNEVSAAIALTHQLYGIGIDGLIIQDYALVAADLPPVPLIASTQMHNHTPERVRFLEDVGFSRVILARELSLEEIKAIRDHTTIELEVFVHGALCVSYSGQCYMSYALGGRSGNRGQCAQPCRRAYDLVTADGTVLVKDKFLLSLKDLNRFDHLEELLAVGITSFKIEGRLKDAAYVTNVVSQYRQKLDMLIQENNLQTSSSGTVTVDFTPDSRKTFNRDYTPYFLHSRDILPGAIDTPKMKGERMGIVTAVHNRNVTLTLSGNKTFNAGDGVCWFDESEKLQGTYVNHVNRNQLILNQSKDIKSGVTLYRNYDHQFVSQLNDTQPVRKIDVAFILSDSSDGVELTAIDDDRNEVTVNLTTDRQAATKVQQAISTIRKQLTKTGGTPYRCKDLRLDVDHVPFIPVSQLNALRRETLDALTHERLAKRPKSQKRRCGEVPAQYPETHLDYKANVLNQIAADFLKTHGVKTIEPAVESGIDMNGKIVMRSRQCIRRQLGWCLKIHKTPHDHTPLYLVDDKGHHYELIFDCDACEMEVRYDK